MESMESNLRKEIIACLEEVREVFERRGIGVSEAGGVLGALFGMLAAKTEDNSPFISFFNSLSSTYRANYCGPAVLNVSGPIELCKDKGPS